MKARKKKLHFIFSFNKIVNSKRKVEAFGELYKKQSRCFLELLRIVTSQARVVIEIPITRKSYIMSNNSNSSPSPVNHITDNITKAQFTAVTPNNMPPVNLKSSKNSTTGGVATSRVGHIRKTKVISWGL
jgi:hypothetical protein